MYVVIKYTHHIIIIIIIQQHHHQQRTKLGRTGNEYAYRRYKLLEYTAERTLAVRVYFGCRVIKTECGGITYRLVVYSYSYVRPSQCCSHAGAGERPQQQKKCLVKNYDDEEKVVQPPLAIMAKTYTVSIYHVVQRWNLTLMKEEPDEPI